jgi:hypothetical protein
MNPLTAPAGTQFRVRMQEVTSSEPRAEWEPGTVTVEDDESWDTAWQGGSRRVSCAAWRAGLPRVYGTWSGLNERPGGIGWAYNWITTVHEYELA